jgi:hypothetical protein
MFSKISDKTEIPSFKYHLDPLASNVFEHKNAKCPVCMKIVSIVYTGPFHSNEDVEDICPWCISDGSAAIKYNGDFQDTQTIENKISKEAMEELIKRTPGYCGWQQEQWLVHCDEPCQFIGYVGWKEIEHQNIDVSDDIIKMSDEYGLKEEEFKSRLVNNSSLQGYLFKCVKCGKYRLTSDCD